MMKKPSKEVLDAALSYQYVLDGKVVNVSDMDRGQLMRALMQCIDVVDKVASSLGEANDRLNAWADGTLEG